MEQYALPSCLTINAFFVSAIKDASFARTYTGHLNRALEPDGTSRAGHGLPAATPTGHAQPHSMKVGMMFATSPTSLDPMMKVPES
ncbi:hypothetical protein [Bilophila sp. 4_1_30]|uniref:hypothetical protein n=1 Tax=Bilophila sp. 4_1_30 TaxID=693988 RepID=UPI0002EADC5C|nr:hypothetical protein [Bilophila sp. 4_1_30]